MGGPRPAPSRGVSPKEGHLSCTEKEQERKRERNREGESVGAQQEVQDKQTQSQGARGWAAAWQLAGCSEAFGRGSALGLLYTGLARLSSI